MVASLKPLPDITLPNLNRIIDGDGSFDDAQGPTPSFTFDKAFDRYVGLRVTNSYNYATVGYAPISIKNNNSPPQIISVSPANTTVVCLN